MKKKTTKAGANGFKKNSENKKKRAEDILTMIRERQLEKPGPQDLAKLIKSEIHSEQTLYSRPKRSETIERLLESYPISHLLDATAVVIYQDYNIPIEDRILPDYERVLTALLQNYSRLEKDKQYDEALTHERQASRMDRIIDKAVEVSKTSTYKQYRKGLDS